MKKIKNFTEEEILVANKYTKISSISLVIPQCQWATGNVPQHGVRLIGWGDVVHWGLQVLLKRQSQLISAYSGLRNGYPVARTTDFHFSVDGSVVSNTLQPLWPSTSRTHFPSSEVETVYPLNTNSSFLPSPLPSPWLPPFYFMSLTLSRKKKWVKLFGLESFWYTFQNWATSTDMSSQSKFTKHKRKQVNKNRS